MTAALLTLSIAVGVFLGRTLSVLVIDAARRARSDSYGAGAEVRFLGLLLRKGRVVG